MAYRSKLRDAAALIFTPEGKLNPETWCRGGISPKYCSVTAASACNADIKILSGASRSLCCGTMIWANDDHPELLPDIWSEAIEADEALNGGE